MLRDQGRASVVVTRASEVGNESTGQSSGMIRKSAIVNKSDKICATVMTGLPHAESDIHHHGTGATIVYALNGKGSIVFEGGKERVQLEPGDFALIPEFCEHQEINETDQEVTWIITRSGSAPIVVNLTGWGGEPK